MQLGFGEHDCPAIMETSNQSNFAQVFVGGVPKTATDAQIRVFCEEVGEVPWACLVFCKLVEPKHTNIAPAVSSLLLLQAQLL